MQHDHGVVDGSVLWIVNHTANGAEDIGEGGTTRQEQASKYEHPGHIFYLCYIKFLLHGSTQLPHRALWTVEARLPAKLPSGPLRIPANGIGMRRSQSSIVGQRKAALP